MIQQDFNDAFVLYLSGIVNERGEVEIIDEHKQTVFVLFPTNTPREAVVRGYHENGQKEYEQNYVNGKLHGQCLGWYQDGIIRWKYTYVNGSISTFDRHDD